MFGMPTVISIWIFVGLMVLAVMLLMSMLARLYRKAGPHEALVVYGFRGTRVVKGHGTIIFPMIENCRGLSLELMSFDVAPQQDLYTKQGVAVTVEAVAQIKVKSDTESILTASEQFLTSYFVLTLRTFPPIALHNVLLLNDAITRHRKH